MAKRPITDDLLKLTLESRIEAGVSRAEVRRLILAFSDAALEDAGDVPSPEQIPDHCRGQFLQALVALPASSDNTVESARDETSHWAGPLSGRAAPLWRISLRAMERVRSLGARARLPASG